MSNELTKFTFEITSMQQAMDYAKLIADSDLAPKDYKGKPGNVLIAIQMGMEIGLKPLQAIQNIAVINGRPSVWGDAMIALVQNHPICEYIHEEFKNDTAYCIVKRRGDDEEHIAKFSRDDAKKAGLLNKPGVWQQYPERMMQMRARGFALRDKFADILKGIALREEVEDYQDIESSPKQARIIQAKTNVKKLIENKKKLIDSPKITIEQIKDKIDNATSIDELTKIAPLAQTLDDNEKKEVRRYYANALEAIKNSNLDNRNEDKEEITDHEEEKPIENSDFDKIKHQILNAKSQDTLDIAVDLVNTIQSDELKKELYNIYKERQNSFKN